MAVKIRMKRMGSKKRPFYRIVVADSRSPRDGRFIEELGYYNPIDKDKTFTIDTERAAYWIGTGAKPSETVEKLFKKNGLHESLMAGRKTNIKYDKAQQEKANRENRELEDEPTEKPQVEDQEGAVKPEESIPGPAELDSEEVVEGQPPVEESEIINAETDVEGISEEAAPANPDPTPTDVIERQGDETDPEEIVEENEKI